MKCFSEIIAIIVDCELKSNLLKFVVKNKNEDLVQILVWSEDIINTLKEKIMPNNVSI